MNEKGDITLIIIIIVTINIEIYRRAGSDGSMSVSGSAGPEFNPRQGTNFNLKIFNLGARRGGDVHFLIVRLYITGLN